MIVKYVTATTLVLGIAILASGCLAQSQPESDAQENVAEAAQALGEVGCETAMKDDPDATAGTFCPCGSGTGWSTSPDAAYDHTNCSHQYLVGYGATGLAYAAIAWADTMPSTQGECERSYLELGGYYKNGSGWQTPVTATIQGTWNSGTSTCSFAHGNACTDPAFSLGSGSFHRLAGAAFTCSSGIFGCSSVTYKKVAVQLNEGQAC